MKNTEIVKQFFTEGYGTKNYQAVMNLLAPDYYDHSPAAARSNADAIGILKIVADAFDVQEIAFLDVFGDGEMVATRIRYTMIHIGAYAGFPASGNRVCFEALENFRVQNGKIAESWGYWPDKDIEQQLAAKS